MTALFAYTSCKCRTNAISYLSIYKISLAISKFSFTTFK